jgi:hypothetical protein
LDLWGSSLILFTTGFKYSYFSWIYFLHSKDELVKVFSLFKVQVKKFLSTKIKILQTNDGTEYELLTHLFPKSFTKPLIPIHPQQNGLAESKHRHIIELSLTIMSQASIPLHLGDHIF